MVFAVLVLVFAVGVYAAGSSTGGNNENSGGGVISTVSGNVTLGVNYSSQYNYTCGNDICEDGEANIPGGCGPNADPRCLGPPERVGTCPQDCKNTSRSNYIYQNKNCETFSTLRERIKCRLIQGNESVRAKSLTEEACRVLNVSKKGKCVAFYASVQTCFKLEGRAKDVCFRRGAGLMKDKLKDEPNEGRGEKVRMYMVAVLYNLQERVEKFHVKGKISDENAAALVEKIVTTKQEILSGKSKAEIRTMVQELKDMWKASIPKRVEEESG